MNIDDVVKKLEGLANPEKVRLKSEKFGINAEHSLGIYHADLKFIAKEIGHDIDWLDLNVLSVNVLAKNLYLKCGFKSIGEISDYYRIEGESLSEILMTKSVKS